MLWIAKVKWYPQASNERYFFLNYANINCVFETASKITVGCHTHGPGKSEKCAYLQLALVTDRNTCSVSVIAIENSREHGKA